MALYTKTRKKRIEIYRRITVPPYTRTGKSFVLIHDCFSISNISAVLSISEFDVKLVRPPKTIIKYPIRNTHELMRSKNHSW